ncbi:ribonuclease H-like domain-containing protein [Tanacetum coccineum]
MKKHMEIVPNDEVAIDAIPLATKSPIIIDWKIIKEEKMGYIQIIRADGIKHGNTRPEEAYERVLWGDLKVMFELDVEKVMEFESAQSNTTAKLPILKLVPVTAKEKTNKKNDVKARNLLLMALPNQLTFSQYSDAKTMFAAIETRFGGNEATKKTQKILLKQQYENFSASSTESLDSIFNRLQKIVSRLAILVWMNKADIETMSIEYLYNNFKIVEQDVKKSVGTSSGAENLAFLTTSSTSSTNDVNTANPAYKVSTVIPNINTACPQVSTTNFSDNTVNVFEVTALSAKYEGKKIVSTVTRWTLWLGNVSNRKEQRGSVQIQRNKTRKQGNNKTYLQREMLAIDGVRRNYQEESFTYKEEMAPMSLSDSEVTTCSKSCLKNYETLKKQYDDLRIELNQSEFNLANYKIGLASVEERLVFYKKNEGMLCDQIAVLKRDASFNESEINALKIQIERLKKEKESNQFKIDNFENASKSLDKLIESQISDNNRKGVGGIGTQMLNQLIATQVVEALAAAAVTHDASTQEETNLSNVAEGDRVKFASSTLLDSALTWWNVYVRSVTLNVAHTTPWNDFKAMFIWKYCPRNEVKQMENELWNLKVKGTNLTTYNQRFQELILLCPEMVPNTDRLLERYIEGLPLNIKGNVTSSKPVDLPSGIGVRRELCVVDTTLTHALLPATTMVGQDIRLKNVELHLILQAKDDLEPKEDRVVMLLASDAVKRAITRTSDQTMETKAIVTRFETVEGLKTAGYRVTTVGSRLLLLVRKSILLKEVTTAS